MSQPGRLLLLWIATVVLSASFASILEAAGGVGHFYIAKRSAEKLLKMPEADELGELLQDPSCLNSFCNGALAPDLPCLVNQAHYGQTTKLPRLLVNLAEDAWEAAAKLPSSDPKRAGRLKEAEKAMCFGLGWLSHCAVDLDIHPTVNARCGDVYEFLDQGGKGKHAAAEVQFSYYLSKTLRKPNDKIAFDIPYWLVSAASGKSQQELEGSVKVMRGKILGELASMDQVTLPLSQLRADWQAIVDASITDTIKFVLNPESMEDWDLDCGRITTEAFHSLRDECIAIKGGSVPSQWGKEYLNWWEQVRNLPPEARHQRLVELIQGETTYQPGRKEVLVRTDGNQKLWVNGREMKYPGNNVVQVPTSGMLTLQVLLYQTYRYICTDHKYRGDNVNLITENPFELHYTSTLYGGPYEHRTMMVKEAYTWKAYDNPGTVKNSGAHPNLIGDVFEWKVPVVRNVYGDSKTFTLNIDCQSEWYQYELHGNPPEVYLNSNPHMLLMIEVEDEIQD